MHLATAAVYTSPYSRIGEKYDFRGETSRLLPFCSASQSRGGGTCPAGPGFGWTTFRRSIFKSLTIDNTSVLYYLWSYACVVRACEGTNIYWPRIFLLRAASWQFNFQTARETDGCCAASLLGAGPLLSCFHRPCKGVTPPNFAEKTFANSREIRETWAHVNFAPTIPLYTAMWVQNLCVLIPLYVPYRRSIWHSHIHVVHMHAEVSVYNVSYLPLATKMGKLKNIARSSKLSSHYRQYCSTMVVYLAICATKTCKS